MRGKKAGGGTRTAALVALGFLGFVAPSAGQAPDLPEGSVVHARAFIEPLGRHIVAFSVRGFGSTRVRMLYSDDEGERWLRANWRGRAPGQLLFAPDGRHGIALGGCAWWMASNMETGGPGGTEISSTTDGGATWRHHGCSRAFLLDRVLLIGRAVVLMERGGRVWRSTNGGRSRRLLVEDREAEVRVDDEAIDVTSGRRSWLVRPDGSVETRRRRR